MAGVNHHAFRFGQRHKTPELVVTSKCFYQIVATATSLFAASSAQAQTAIDCNAVKTTSIPVELTLHTRELKHVVQVFRTASGNDTIWIQIQASTGTQVVKLLTSEGFPAESLSSAPSSNTLIRFKSDYDGLPKKFDHRSNLDYKAVITSTDGRTSAVQHSYRFKSEDQINIGPCVLIAVRGDDDTTITSSQGGPPTVTKIQKAVIYLPELRLQIVSFSRTSEIIFDDIKTSFTPLTHGAQAQLPPQAQLAPATSATQPCSAMPTPDCLLAEAAASARYQARAGGILGSLGIADLANVARAYAKLGRKELADRAFADADAQAKLARDPMGNSEEYLVVRALFAAGRVDEAMARANRVERRAVATAAIDALIAAGRPEIGRAHV